MKHSIFFILSVLFCFIAFSQEKKSKITYGIKVGTTQSTLSPDVTYDNGAKSDFRYKTGFTFGGRIQFEAGKDILLLPELSLVGKGAKIFVSSGSGSYLDHSPTLSTFAELTLNVLKQFSSSKGKFMLGGGPSLGINTDEYSQELGKSDIGINILAAYQLPIGFSFELNFNKGLKEQTGNIYYSSTPRKVKTSVFGFCLGYIF